MLHEFLDHTRKSETSLCYSSRAAVVGSSLAARRAGTHDAKTAKKMKSAEIMANVDGSVGLTPISMPVITRVRASAAKRPIRTPVVLFARVWRQ